MYDEIEVDLIGLVYVGNMKFCRIVFANYERMERSCVFVTKYDCKASKTDVVHLRHKYVACGN